MLNLHILSFRGLQRMEGALPVKVKNYCPKEYRFATEGSLLGHMFGYHKEIVICHVLY